MNESFDYGLHDPVWGYSEAPAMELTPLIFPIFPRLTRREIAFYKKVKVKLKKRQEMDKMRKLYE